MASGIIDLPWWGYLVVGLVVTHITIASVTIFLHRCQAHRALDLSPLPAHFFRLWLWLTTGMVTKQWTAIHRKHHAKCETAEDPHSPQVKGLRKVLSEGAELYRAEARNPETLARYGAGTPDDWLERHLYSRHPTLGVSITLIVNLILFGPLGLTLWAVQMAWIPFWAAGVINGLAHYWGYRNFTCQDASTNLTPWGLIVGGEELHNNHHAFATSAKFSNKWYEFDIGWLYIRLLEMAGLARVKKVAPRPRLAALRPEVDSLTLQAVITHRYDLLTRYAKSLRQVYMEELQARKSRLRGTELKRAKELRRWLGMDPKQLPAELTARLERLLENSVSLKTLYAMRQELTELWERSNATKEQLLAELQDWCRRAEASGIRQLEELSLRLRRYAV
ncbi:MAG: fatty acid desaturase [Betaproteobacteria bacterium]|nr:fatty acid desaturase [Betaproteobacteria bacterium]